MDQERPGASPLDELKRLDDQVEQVSDLAGLKPIFYRLEEISKQFSGDFDVQLVVADVKQHLVSKGMRLKEALTANTTSTGNTPTAPQPLFSNSPPGGTPTVGSSGFQASGQHAAEPQPPSSTPLPGQLPSSKMPSSKMPASPSPTSQAPSPPPPPPAKPPGGPAFPPPGPAPRGSAPQPPLPNWKRSVGIGAIIGLVLFAAFVVLVQMARHRNMPGSSAPAGTVPVDISTVPAGASIRINNDVKCTSNCRLNLTPGNYTITALLDGYEPAASGVTV
ncbi:MAG: PEGA domain-containing protein, partial [Bryobacteraceae bacterium]